MTKTAIITAASSGIGLGAAQTLAAEGWQLVLMSRSEAVESVARDLGATALRGDVTNPDDLAALVDLAVQRHERIDGAVINTGHAPKGEILEIPGEDWHAGLDMVLMPTVRMVSLLAPMFAAQKSGAMVAVSSFAAREPDLAYPLSTVFRAALASYLKLCVARHGDEGWRINAVLPGFMDNYAAQEASLARIPAARHGKVADELGSTIAFLLSAGAGYINGQGILVDGGLSRAL